MSSSRSNDRTRTDLLCRFGPGYLTQSNHSDPAKNPTHVKGESTYGRGDPTATQAFYNSDKQLIRLTPFLPLLPQQSHAAWRSVQLQRESHQRTSDLLPRAPCLGPS